MKRLIRQSFLALLTPFLITSIDAAPIDAQARAVTMIRNLDSEEIVLQSVDYVFTTKYGKIKVKFSKSNGKDVMNFVLSPPLEGDTGSMMDQANSITSAFTDAFTGNNSVLAEVIGLNGGIVQMMPFRRTEGIEVGCKVVSLGESLSVPVGDMLLGRVLDGLGRAADGKGDIFSPERYPALASPPDPMSRSPIVQRMVTGIRAIDSLLAVGKGQRLGIFSGSGVGKSTLQGLIARNTSADV